MEAVNAGARAKSYPVVAIPKSAKKHRHRRFSVALALLVFSIISKQGMCFQRFHPCLRVNIEIRISI